MYPRIKQSGNRQYLQIVESRREGPKVKQDVLCTLGRLDELRESGQLDRLTASLARHCDQSLVLSAARAEWAENPEIHLRHVGPGLVFDRLWEETGCREAVAGLAAGRRFGFDLERVVFFSVLHRLFAPGSDRQAERWGATRAVAGLAPPALRQLYRAMAWLGEPCGEKDPDGRERTTKDLLEERLFAARRGLFARLDLVFFDTTSLYFHGAGGEELGRRGHSKDHRPQLKQLVLGMVLDQTGTPLCSEMWPGNTADVTTLLPVAERLSRRFGIGSVCVVADRGMVSAANMKELERRGWRYVLGAKMRTVTEIRDQVIADPGPWEKVPPPPGTEREREPLFVKEVVLRDEKGERRYLVCRNETQARRDREARAKMVADLREKLRTGPKKLVANKGYARYLRADGRGFEIDEEKTEAEAKYDGIFVLRSNAGLSSAETALRYKELWRVEHTFRKTKSDLKTRAIYHQSDAAIRGHVFCSFLALVLRHELFRRLGAAGVEAEWNDVVRDLDHLCEGVIEKDGKRFVARTAAVGITTKVFHSLRLRLPPVLRREGGPTPSAA